MKGTHIPKSRKQLSFDERELLSTLLEVERAKHMFFTTAKKINEMMQWNDIRRTTSTLSNLVGMDLCVETSQETKMKNEDTGEFSSNEPLYGIPFGSTQWIRANYAKNRIQKGSTLWHIKNIDKLKKNPFGDEFWPNRAIDRVKTKGKVEFDKTKGKNKLYINYDPEDLKHMVGKEIDITISLP